MYTTTYVALNKVRPLEESASGVGAAPVIRRAQSGDLASVLSLLEGEGLPTEGVEEWLSHFVVAHDRDGITLGVGGLEHYGDDGILRSLAVRSSHRARGMGAALTRAVMAAAASRGVKRLFLLTTTAEHYFPRHGFRVIDRQHVVGPVTRSVEFRGACPETALVMVRDLENRRIHNQGRG